MKHLVLNLGVLLVISSSYSEEKQKKRSSPSPAVKIENRLERGQTKADTINSIAGLSWHSDIDVAFNLAQKENKRVIVMVGEKYCKWCKKMKERTLTDRRIQKKLKEYIRVSIKRSDEASVQKLYEFDGNIPSFFFMKQNRELIEHIIGYFHADDFLQYITEIEE